MTRATFEEVLELNIRAGARGIRVAGPACVLSVNRAAGTVGLQLEQRRPRTDPDEPADVDPNLADVPIVFPSSTAVEISFQIDPGDRGLVIYADYSLGVWRESGTLVDPGPGEAHGLSGAVFIPGLWPVGDQVEIPEAGVIVGLRGGERLEVSSGQVRCGSGASALAITDRFVDDTDSVMADIDTYLIAEDVWVTAVGTLVPAATAAFKLAIAALRASIVTYRASIAMRKTTVTRIK